LNGGGEPVSLICVADGVGGSSRGDLASRLAVQGIREFVESSHFHSLLELKIRIPDFLNGLSKKISQSVAPGQTANTTLTACLVFGGESLLIHSGDSMLCTSLVGKTDFMTLTDAHSCKSDCVIDNADEDAGQGISPNAISAGLGSGFISVRYQVAENFLPSGAPCWVVALTDGVHVAVTRPAIVRLCRGAKTPDALARSLVQAALDAEPRTRDNATAAVYRAGPWRRAGNPGRAAALGAVVVVGGMMLLWQGVHAGSGVDPAPPENPGLDTGGQDASMPKAKAEKTRKTDEATEAARLAERLDATLASARAARAAGRWAECLKHANAALVISPGHPDALALKDESAKEMRKADEAAEAARLADEKWTQARVDFNVSEKKWGDVEDLHHAFSMVADAMKTTGGLPSDANWVQDQVKSVGKAWIQEAKAAKDPAMSQIRSDQVRKVQDSIDATIRQAKGK
jgi:protein phosphatase